jgi:hypothetical protein
LAFEESTLSIGQVEERTSCPSSTAATEHQSGDGDGWNNRDADWRRPDFIPTPLPGTALQTALSIFHVSNSPYDITVTLQVSRTGVEKDLAKRVLARACIYPYPFSWYLIDLDPATFNVRNRSNGHCVSLF